MVELFYADILSCQLEQQLYMKGRHQISPFIEEVLAQIRVVEGVIDSFYSAEGFIFRTEYLLTRYKVIQLLYQSTEMNILESKKTGDIKVKRKSFNEQTAKNTPSHGHGKTGKKLRTNSFNFNGNFQSEANSATGKVPNLDNVSELEDSMLGLDDS
jgi:hypothetical protein